MNIEELRKKIDKIDLQILDLLNKRAKLVKEVGKKKKEKNLSFYAPAREKQIFQRLTEENKGPLSDIAVKNIFKEILSSCLALEKSIKIAYLGPPATFTHIATLSKFGTGINAYPVDSISDVFYSIEKKVADYGVVPVENSTEGVVNHTLDMFINSNLLICAEIYINVSHHLLSLYKLEEITKVYSNPQAFSQCKIWIKNNLSKSVQLIETSSTTKAVEIAQKEKYSAAIASQLAAQLYNMNILAEDIQDNPYNRTRFLVIGDAISESSGKDKTSLIFSVQHKPGALYRSLSPLNKRKVNMTMIESRPTGDKLWEYVFFIDIQGYYLDENINLALKEMEKECHFIKILGSYPEAE